MFRDEMISPLLLFFYLASVSLMTSYIFHEEDTEDADDEASFSMHFNIAATQENEDVRR